MTKDGKIPGGVELLWPVLKTIRDLDNSASRAELLEHVPEVAGFTEEQLEVVDKRGNPTVLNRAEWAIHWLKEMGVFELGASGVYTVTPEGDGYLAMDDAAAGAALTTAYRTAYREARKSAAKKTKATKSAQPKGTVDAVGTEPAAGNDAPAEVVAGTGPVSGDGWRAMLLEILQKMPPAGFERLARRILREAGFQEVDVVGRAGDGTDGTGLYRTSLVSFPIYFQCKRDAGSVGARAVRDFREAMAGRGDKGLIITTGTFTSAAREEATRDGVPPIELIDGGKLCGLIRKYKLGVVERVTVDESFFETL